MLPSILNVIGSSVVIPPIFDGPNPPVFSVLVVLDVDVEVIGLIGIPNPPNPLPPVFIIGIYLDVDVLIVLIGVLILAAVGAPV